MKQIEIALKHGGKFYARLLAFIAVGDDLDLAFLG
jgi:hypothetical protein